MIQAAVLKRLRAVLPAQNCLENEPMRLHTTFRIWGAGRRTVSAGK